MSKEDEINKNLQIIQKAMRKPIYPDFRVVEMQKQIVANSALEMQRQIEQSDSVFQEMAERQERQERTIQRTAQESIEHTKLLENQLKEMQAQNEILRMEIRESRSESESNHKTAKKANHLSIMAIVLSSIFSVSSIVASVLIALYLQ